MKALVIWNEIPEKTTYYIATVDDNARGLEIIANLRACHGHYINLENSEETDVALEKLQYRLDAEEFPEFEEIAEPLIFECNSHLDYICMSGFIL